MVDERDDDDDDVPELEEEVEEGESALAEGDHHEALMRAARALSVAPNDPQACAFADRAIEASPDALALLGNEQDVSYGIFAMRARALAKARRFAEAIDLALQLANFRPRLPYLTWAAEWAAALREASRDQAAKFVARLEQYVETVLDLRPWDEGIELNASAACAFLQSLRAASDERVKVSYFRSLLLRRLGRVSEAICEAETAYSEQPSWLTAVELAAAYRSAGKVDDAVRCYRAAAAFDPADDSAWLDMGDVLLDAKRYAHAAEAYGYVLARDGRHPWAEASSLFAAMKLGDDDARRRLSQLAKQGTKAGERARALLRADSDAP